MRDGPSSEVLAGAAGWSVTLVSRLNGRVLNPDVRIPVTSGRLVAVGGAEVPERLTFSVPEYSDGVSWIPDSALHPLAKHGQVIEVLVTVTSSVTYTRHTTRLGQLKIADWRWDDEQHRVNVTAYGTLHRVKEARFRVPETPRSGGTFFSEFRRLVPSGIPVVISDELEDRGIPGSFLWEQDRLKAIYEIADALPARIRTDQWGAINLLPVLPDVPQPVLYLKDGEGGTVISAPRSDTREGIYNVMVGTSSAPRANDLPPVRVVVEHTEGPMAVTTDGLGYGEVVGYVSSPLVETEAQVRAMAAKALADSLRPAEVRSVSLPPDPRIDLDDPVSVQRGDFGPDWGWVVGYDLPLTVEDGDMRVDVGVSA